MGFLFGKLFSIVIAFSGQFLAQSPQPIQPTLQADITSLPLQCDEQATYTDADFGISSITCLAQPFTQTEQPVHNALFVTATPFTTVIAPKLQCASQLPPPRQPAEHFLSPPK